MPVEKGAQLIAGDILREAKDKSSEIIRAAKHEAKVMLDAARFGAREEEENEVKEARAQGKQVQEQLVAEGRMKAKRAMLQKREGLISEVFKAAEEKLRTYASSEEYEKDLVSITAGACERLGQDNVVIRANRRDLKTLEKVKDQIMRELGNSSVSFGEPIQTIGGVRIATSDGKVEIDETLEGRMRREFEALRVKVAKVLFEGSR